MLIFIFLFQCAFDIVTPTEGSLIADAEVLCVSDKILQVFYFYYFHFSKLKMF